MNFLQRCTLLSAFALLTLAWVGCDSDDPEPTPDPTPFCEDADNQNTLQCAAEAREVRYDTTGTIITVQDLDPDRDGLGQGVAPRVNQVTWTNDFTYVLDGFVFVNDGQTLTIEPGTVIQGTEGQAEDASALIVARGGTIMAEGTADEPIIFTSVQDTGNLPAGANGLWGGLIVLGNAGLNSAPGFTAIEGLPTAEARGLYGVGSGFMQDDADNSGVIRYVSIRYGGTNIGANNEINGLTLGGVGSGTTVEYVEVINNADDGIEFFGGTVNTKYLVCAFVGDDCFDTDEGYRGSNQFWFAIQSPGGDRGGEHDGGTTPETGTPLSNFVVSNATFIGGGIGSDADKVLEIREYAAPRYYNSLFTEFNSGLRIEDKMGDDPSSRDLLDNGTLVLANNYWYNINGADDFEDIIKVSTFDPDNDPDTDNDEDVDPAFRGFLAGYLTGSDNVISPNGILAGISRTPNGGLDPRPVSVDAADFSYAPLSDSFFSTVGYVGAFSATGNWLDGWTALDALGYLGN